MKTGIGLIGSLVKKFINPDFFYSDFSASKAALIDLVALEVVQLDPKSPQLQRSQYVDVDIEASMRSTQIASNQLNCFDICYKAFHSLLSSPARNSYPVDNYLIFLLANALKKIIPLSENEQKISTEFQKNIENIEIQVKYVAVLNNFFNYLKNINTQVLKDDYLTHLLSHIDSDEGLIISPEQLLKEYRSLLENVSLYLCKQLNTSVTNEN